MSDPVEDDGSADGDGSEGRRHLTLASPAHFEIERTVSEDDGDVLLTVVMYQNPADPGVVPAALLPFRCVHVEEGANVDKLLRADIRVDPFAPDDVPMRRLTGHLAEATVTQVLPPVVDLDILSFEESAASGPEDDTSPGLFGRLGPWITVAFWAVAAAIAAFRYFVLTSSGAPATIDSGNWLAFADSFFGGGSRASSITYPPLVPILTKTLVETFGVVEGIALMGALSALAPGVGLYFALKMCGVGRLRVVPALLLLTASSVGEAAAWGGFPQLLGLGLLPIAIVIGWKTFDEPRIRTGIHLGLVLALSLAISHFMSVVVILSLVIIAGVSILSHFRDRQWFVGLLKAMPFIVVPSLLFLPVYLKLVDAVFLNSNNFASLDNLTFSSTLERLDGVYPDFPLLWEVLLPLAIVTPALAWSKRRTPTYRLLSVVMPATVILLVATREGRYLYLVPLICAAGIGVWLSDPPSRTTLAEKGLAAPLLVAFGVGIVLIVQMQAGLALFDDHRTFYGVLEPGLVDAIDAVDDVTDGDDTIAVPSLGDAPIGWWVEALTEGEVYYGSPLRWLNFPDEVARASAANEIFDLGFPNDSTLAEFDELSIDAVIIPRRWAWFDDETVDRWIEDNGLEVLERNDEALAVRLR